MAEKESHHEEGDKVTKHSARFRRPPLAGIRRVSLSLSSSYAKLIIINCKHMKEEK